MRAWLPLILAGLLGLSGISAHAYLLQFKDTAGTSRNFKTVMNIKGSMEAASMNVPFTSVATYLAVEKVTAVNANGAALSYALKNGTVSVKITGLPGDEENQTIEQALPAFAMVYSRTLTGKVINLKMNEQPMTSMAGPYDATGEQLQYPSQGLEFPTTDVNIGDSWTGKESIEIGAGNKITVNATYTLTGTKAVNGVNLVVITCNFTSAAPALSANTVTGGAQASTMTMSMAMSGQSTTLFDPQAGALVSEAIKGNVLLTAGNVPGAEGMSITSKMTLDGTIVRTN